MKGYDFYLVTKVLHFALLSVIPMSRAGYSNLDAKGLLFRNYLVRVNKTVAALYRELAFKILTHPSPSSRNQCPCRSWTGYDEDDEGLVRLLPVANRNKQLRCHHVLVCECKTEIGLDLL